MKDSSNQTNNLAGKLWLASIGLILIMVGSLFVWYLFAVYEKACLMDNWVETPCTIQKSTIDDSGITQHHGTMFAFEISYAYDYQGTTFEGKQCKRIQPASGDRKKIEPYLERYPVGPSVCFVDPATPENSVLKRDSKAALYSIWFPSLFILGGIGIIVSTFRKKR